MSEGFDCHYGEEEFRAVATGIEAIRAVLTGADVHARERLLFYLDWYMDPYYGKDLSAMAAPLTELLQEVAVTDKNAGVVEEALHLLEAYTEGPYPILEKNADKVPEEFRPAVLYLLNPKNW